MKSKAQEWIEDCREKSEAVSVARGRKPEPYRDGNLTLASVDDDGGINLHSSIAKIRDPEAALALARWILDTFGEVPEDDPGFAQ